MLKGAKAYVSTQVTTTTQGDLLIMLYDAAIKFLNQAKVEMDNKDYAKKGILISRAIDILSELASSLNKDKGGPLASNLSAIYLFCSTQLAKANLRMDKKMIDEVIGLLTPIRDAYAQIVPQYDKPLAPSASVGSSSAPAPGAGAVPKPASMNLSRGAYAAQSVHMQQMQQTAAPTAQQPAASEAPAQPAPQKPSAEQQAPAPRTVAEQAPAAEAPAAEAPATEAAAAPAQQAQPAAPQAPDSAATPEKQAQPKTEKPEDRAQSPAEAKPAPAPQPNFTLNAARIRAANAYGNSR